MLELNNLIYSLFIIFGALFLGYFCRKKNIINKRDLIAPELIKLTAIFIMPPISLIAFWGFEHPFSFNLLLLPLSATILTVINMFIAKVFCKFHNLDRKQAGSFVTSAMFSNVGYTAGSFVVFALLGEEGFAFSVLYVMYFSLCFYTLGFYVARHFGKTKTFETIERKKMKLSMLNPGVLISIAAKFLRSLAIKDDGRRRMRDVLMDNVHLYPLAGIFIALILKGIHIPRPPALDFLNSILIPLSSFIWMFSVGLMFKFSSIKKYIREVFSISVIKFLISPILTLGIIAILRVDTYVNEVASKMIFIQSFMPVAVSSLMLPSLFNLDQDLSNASWAFTTILLMPVMICVTIFIKFI